MLHLAKETALWRVFLSEPLTTLHDHEAACFMRSDLRCLNLHWCLQMVAAAGHLWARTQEGFQDEALCTRGTLPSPEHIIQVLGITCVWDGMHV